MEDKRADEQAREWLDRTFKNTPLHPQVYAELSGMLARVRQQALEEAELAFKGAYSDYDEPIIGVMWGLKAIASLRQEAREAQ